MSFWKNKTEDDYIKLLKEHHELIKTYSELCAKYADLQNIYRSTNKDDYLGLLKRHEELLTNHSDVIVKYNNLVKAYHTLQVLLANKGQHPATFTEDDIKKLLILCHPDKHDGKKIAVEITQKILKVRGR